ncbi:MAG: four-helix bundle copper-binding protein [Planctomycetes bacterium]|nr:four-helix bundle copper-binding protein [Planctomycetota bacterium]
MLRIAFTAATLFAGCYLLVAAAEPGQPPFPKPSPASLPKADVDPRMPMFLTCAKACDDCGRMCDLCSAQCGKMLADGKKEHLATMRMCQDCAAICMATARVAGKDGPMADLMYTACVEACKRCGDACDKVPDAMMKQCAAECRRCEKVCREMSKPATPKE